MPQFSGVPVHIILHALSLFVVVLYGHTVTDINYERSPTTEQFTATKMSDNALKQGVEHTQCCVSAVHNCKNTKLHDCLVE